jgi:hypothetical protein
MSVRTILCAECQAPTPAVRKNTKYCRLCRLIKNIKFITTGTRKCWICDVTFAPLDRSDVLCGTCDDHPSHSITGSCRLCNTERTLHSDEVRVCWVCLKDPAQRPLVLRALVKKRNELRRKREAG